MNIREVIEQPLLEAWRVLTRFRSGQEVSQSAKNALLKAFGVKQLAHLNQPIPPIDITKWIKLPDGLSEMTPWERREFEITRNKALTILYGNPRQKGGAIRELESAGITIKDKDKLLGNRTNSSKHLLALHQLSSYLGKGYSVRWIDPPKFQGLNIPRPKGQPRHMVDPKNYQKAPRLVRPGINPRLQKGHVKGAGLYTFDLDTIWPMIGHEFVPGTDNKIAGLRNVPMGLHEMGKIAVFKPKSKRILDLDTLSFDDEIEMIRQAERWLVKKGYNKPKQAARLKSAFIEFDLDPGQSLSYYISRASGANIARDPTQPKTSALFRTNLYKVATQADAITYFAEDFKVVFYFNPNDAKHVETIDLTRVPDVDYRSSRVPGQPPVGDGAKSNGGW